MKEEIIRTKFEGKEIILVGTAHISQESIELVKKTIEKENPDVVGVELDSNRLKQLRSRSKWREMDLFQVMRSGQSYLLLLNLLLAGIQKKFGENVGVKPGAEMVAAVDAAENAGAHIELLDRDIAITMKRAFAEMGFIEKIKLFIGLLMSFFGEEEILSREKVEELKDKDILSELMEQLGKEMPKTKKVLVDERDLFIANKILSADARKIVAVVGIGHIKGIQRFLDRKREIRSISRIPKRANYFEILKYLFPVLFIAIVGLGLYYKGFDTVVEILVIWIAVNGTLAALGAMAAKAHWKAILAAFLAAPLTSLHPALAAGWFAGLVELRERCPRISDFESLNELKNLPDFYNNRVSHVLLVAALANLGSALGTFIALSIAASML